jgi:hypothetical protein
MLTGDICTCAREAARPESKGGDKSTHRSKSANDGVPLGWSCRFRFIMRGALRHSLLQSNEESWGHPVSAF